jgi:hypothetical protein
MQHSTSVNFETVNRIFLKPGQVLETHSANHNSNTNFNMADTDNMDDCPLNFNKFSYCVTVMNKQCVK